MRLCLYIFALIFTAVGAFGHFKIREKNIDKWTSTGSIIIFSLVTVILYYNSVNAIDSNNYQVRFNYVDSLSNIGDILFVYFIKFVRLFTSNYQIFRGIVGLIYLLPIIYITKHEKYMNVPMYLFLCLFFPYFQNMVALRHMMASSIAMLVIYMYLNSKQTWKHGMLTVAALLATALIHDTNFIYVLILGLYVIMKKIRNPKSVIFIIFLIGVGLIFSLRLNFTTGFVKILIGEFDGVYLANFSGDGFGFVIPLFFHLSFILLLNYVVKKKRKEGICEQYEQDLLLLNYASLIVIFGYSVNVLMFRLFRSILLLDYIIFCKNIRGKNNNFLIFTIMVLSVICMLFDASGVKSIISVFFL